MSVNRVWPRAAVQLCRGCARTGSGNLTRRYSKFETWKDASNTSIKVLLMIKLTVKTNVIMFIKTVTTEYSSLLILRAFDQTLMN